MARPGRIAAHRASPRGFVLLVVLLIVAMLASIVTVTLREATNGFREAATAKNNEIFNAVAAEGLSAALGKLETLDPATLQETTYDLFTPGSPDPAFIPWFNATNGGFPFRVQVGLLRGQRTEPDPGEDVKNAYGVTLELQIQVQYDNTLYFASQQQERVVAGVRVPQQVSHSD
jgi:hypothetical protein